MVNRHGPNGILDAYALAAITAAGTVTLPTAAEKPRRSAPPHPEVRIRMASVSPEECRSLDSVLAAADDATRRRVDMRHVPMTKGAAFEVGRLRKVLWPIGLEYRHAPVLPGESFCAFCVQRPDA